MRMENRLRGRYFFADAGFGMAQRSRPEYVLATEYERSAPQAIFNQSQPPGKNETTEKSPSADARVGAHAGHPATSAVANAPSAAIHVCPLEAFQYVEKR